MAINNWVGGLAQIAEIFPQVMDIPDADKIARETAALAGVPTRLTRDEKVVEEERKQKAEQAKTDQAIDMMQRGGDAAQSMGAGVDAMGGMEGMADMGEMTEQ